MRERKKTTLQLAQGVRKAGTNQVRALVARQEQERHAQEVRSQQWPEILDRIHLCRVLLHRLGNQLRC